MDRLTIKCTDEPTFVPDGKDLYFIDDEFGAKCLAGEVVDRLAQFEDTALEPSEILALKAEVERLEDTNKALESDNYNAELNNSRLSDKIDELEERLVEKEAKEKEIIEKALEASVEDLREKFLSDACDDAVDDYIQFRKEKGI